MPEGDSLRIAHAGTLINPLLAEGQVHGGMALGAAEVLMEAVHYDPDGNLRTTNFADYPVIGAGDLPMFEVHHLETPTWVNPLGAKGIGESGTVGALTHQLQTCGIRSTFLAGFHRLNQSSAWSGAALTH